MGGLVNPLIPHGYHLDLACSKWLYFGFQNEGFKRRIEAAENSNFRNWIIEEFPHRNAINPNLTSFELGFFSNNLHFF